MLKGYVCYYWHFHLYSSWVGVTMHSWYKGDKLVSSYLLIFFLAVDKTHLFFSITTGCLIWNNGCFWKVVYYLLGSIWRSPNLFSVVQQEYVVLKNFLNCFSGSKMLFWFGLYFLKKTFFKLYSLSKL